MCVALDAPGLNSMQSNVAASSVRSDISNAAGTFLRYGSAPKSVCWNAVLCILAHIKGTEEYDVPFLTETSAGVLIEVFAVSDYASKVTDMWCVSGGAITCRYITPSISLGVAVKSLLFMRQVSAGLAFHVI